MNERKQARFRLHVGDCRELLSEYPGATDAAHRKAPKACMFEGFRFVGMDLTPEYEPIARTRITHAINEQQRLDPFGFGP